MMIRTGFAAAIALLAADGALAQAAPEPQAAPAAATTGPERRFTAQDLFDLSMASDPQISPDGSRIAYVRVSNDVMTDRARRSIWLVDTRTGEQVPLAGATGEGDALSPRWSPDG
ncbi:MAG: S9 family peptidase, partial [Erythrobacter sp.]